MENNIELVEQLENDFETDTVNTVLTSELLPEEEKSKILYHFRELTESASPEEIAYSVLAPLSGTTHQQYKHYLTKESALQITSNNLCTILYLYNQGLRTEDIILGKLHQKDFEDTICVVEYLKQKGIHILNTLKSYPEFFNLSLEDIEEIRLDNIKKNPISEECLQLIDKKYNESFTNKEILLTKEEEITLFQGLEDVRKCLRRWEEIKDTSQTLEDIIARMNQGLVRSIGKSFLTIIRTGDTTYNPNFIEHDFYQAGNIGLLKAIRAYDYRLGFKFSTFAIWEIRRAIQTELASSSTIRLPEYMRERLSKINKNEGNLESFSDIELNSISKAFNSIKTNPIKNPKQVETDEIHPDQAEIENLIDNADPIHEVVEIEEEKSSVKNLLYKEDSTLTERERNVLIWRFGIESRKEESLAQIAERLGLTKGRIQQIEATALKKLRKLS